MRLKQIAANQWKIYAAVSDRGDCTLFDFLCGLDNSLSTHRDSMLSLLEQVSEDVRNPEQWMTTRKCHPITNDKQIWQFTVGSIRVAWFYDKDRVIICTHGFIKDSNNTKKTDQKTAQSTRDKYFHAQKLNNISIEDGE